MAQYKLKDIFASKDVLVTTVDGDAVNLAGKMIKRIVPATNKLPQHEKIIRAATQADLEKVYNRGSKYIERVESKPTVVEDDKKK